jgi:predicted AlkP superfamily pyrophosphatase or phosphodiesterase
MKKAILQLSLLCAACGMLHAAGNSHRRVIVISLDGFPAYALKDPRLPAPNLRALIEHGAVAEGMTTVNPTVTWPNHTSMVTGVGPDGHQVLFNGKIMFHGPGRAVTLNESPNEDEVVKAPTVYDLAAKAGLVTAQVAWPAAIGARSIRWSFDEKPDPDGEIARELVARGACTEEQLRHFGGSDAWRDELYTQAAIDILERHRPDLLFLHLSASDMLQHEHGPRSSVADLAYAFEDDRVGQIVDALRKLGLLEDTAILIVSDHGFRVVHHEIDLNAFLFEKGWATKDGVDISAQAWTLPHGGVAMAYITDPARRAELIPQLQEMFAGLEGVDHVYTAKDYASLGLPLQSKTDQSPDLFLTAKIDYYFDEAISGPSVRTVERSGEHGYLSTDADMNAIFVASGSGIRSGVRTGVIPNVDVAPTIARLLGIAMPDIQGKPRTEILDVHP